ncbi:ABC transporter substrate-binding protein [Actinokineospora iranica]|uniref:ABC-type branched-chain amino acid transport system, substrate-binding protein n=1 Tax=Actinokineospora iranica TaxID=1271860 RepID=A0A1G6U6I6_9PSEU|nr:ABC transporter substrate-binding protein [Actinokineospora iranica]SDD36824.1 hypothetical protein SAMN05216174_110127 [Actinokineospora iranica]
MIKPISGVQSVLPLIDHIAETRPYLPPLVIGVLSADPDEARAFVAGYRDRLFDIGNRALVPSAHAGKVTAGIAKTTTSPDVGFLDEIAKQLRSSVPAGAGRRWRTKQFRLCLDVIQAAGIIDTTTAEGTRQQLLAWLYSRWEKRNRLLSWVRTMSTEDLPIQFLGTVLVALLSGPSRWWFGRRLNSRKLRWFGEHLTNATGLHGDFLDQAVYLLPDSGLEDVTALRRRVLFDALLHDIALFTRRRRFLPHRRRRRWTPVLLLDATDSPDAKPAADLVDMYVELTRTASTMPLLVVAALSDNATPTTATAPVLDIDKAAPALRALVNKTEADPPRRLALRLPPDPPVDPIAETYLRTHRRVTPRIPGRLSAWAPLALTVLLITAGGGFGTYRHLVSGCAGTRVDALGQRVGIIEKDCSFDQPPSAPGVPNLSDLEQAVFANNAAVDLLRDENNQKRYHREIVFFAPLTRPNTAERTAPPNSIWQLRGAVEAQREHNDDAAGDVNRVPIKLVLANSGDRFADGDWVAAKIAERPRSDNGGLAAVIGISQSRPIVSKAIRDHLKDIPVIGSSMYGSRMAENDNMFLSAPLNAAFADRMTAWLAERGYGSRAAVVYDPGDDYFSRELRDLLRARGVGSPETDIEIEEGDSADIADRDIAAMCANADNRIPVLTNRADQVLKFLDRAKNIDSCVRRPTPLPILSGPGLIVEAATDTLAERYPWARLTMTSLAPSAVESEESTGRDAFRIAAAAIKEAQISAKGVWKPALAQSMLHKTEVFETLGLPRLNDASQPNRIWLVDLTP